MSNKQRTPPGSDRSDNIRRIMLFGLIIASIVLIGGAAIFVYIVARSANSGPDAMVAVQMPYSADLRPLPKNTDPGTILPTAVGAFKRTSLSGSMSALTGQIAAQYANGSSMINIHVAQDATDSQAEADLSALAAGVPFAGRTFTQIDNAGYLLATDPKTGKVRFIYVRRYWLFDVTASDQKTLDAFEGAFGY